MRMRYELSNKNTELSRIHNELDSRDEIVNDLRGKLNTSRAYSVREHGSERMGSNIKDYTMHTDEKNRS